METEIKLRLRNQDDLLATLESPLINRLTMPDSKREMELVNVYYDTAGRDLTTRQMTLRTRQDGDRTIVTLKSGNSAQAELHQRFEWSAALPEDWDGDLKEGLDTSWFKREASSNGDPDAKLQEALRLLKNQALSVICEAKFNRITLDIGYGDSLLELALDNGKLSAGELSEPVCELEVELKEGDVRDLVELSQEMQAQLPVEPEPRSKYARCLALLVKQNKA